MAGADAQSGLHPIDKQLLDQSQWDFSDLKAIFIDCTLKRSPAVSNTQALADRSIAICVTPASTSMSSGQSTTTSRQACTRT